MCPRCACLYAVNDSEACGQIGVQSVAYQTHCEPWAEIYVYVKLAYYVSLGVYVHVTDINEQAEGVKMVKKKEKRKDRKRKRKRNLGLDLTLAC